jgi:DNA-binding HxlR family transcriptional regulator
MAYKDYFLKKLAKDFSAPKERLKALQFFEDVFTYRGALRILYALDIHDELRFKDFEYGLKIKRSSLTYILRHLKERGLITTRKKRVEKKELRKVKAVFYRLTPKGRDFLHLILGDVGEWSGFFTGLERAITRPISKKRKKQARR